MAAFDHVLLLLSFVYALAITHLLSRIAALLIDRGRVRFSGLLVLAMVNALSIVYGNWLSLWDLRGTVGWDIASITVQFGIAVSQFLLCAFVAPEARDGEVIDMEAYFWRQRRAIYGAYVALCILSAFGNATFLKSPNPKLFLEENAADLGFLVLAALGFTVSARWAQWAVGVLLFVITVTFIATFSPTLH